MKGGMGLWLPAKFGEEESKVKYLVGAACQVRRAIPAKDRDEFFPKHKESGEGSAGSQLENEMQKGHITEQNNSY